MEALLVIVLDKSECGELVGSRFFLTDAQIVEVASDRHPETTWDAKGMQVRREKEKWVLRIGKREAREVPLLLEIRTGNRPPGQEVGEPSEYELSALLELLSKAHPVGARGIRGRTAEAG